MLAGWTRLPSLSEVQSSNHKLVTQKRQGCICRRCTLFKQDARVQIPSSRAPRTFSDVPLSVPFRSDVCSAPALQELEDRLVRTEAKAEVYEGKHAVAQKTMNALKVGIQNIFTKIGCATPAVKELLGEAGVTESNMMQVKRAHAARPPYRSGG